MGCSQDSESASVTAACKLAQGFAASVSGTLRCQPELRPRTHAAHCQARATAVGTRGCESHLWVGFSRAFGVLESCTDCRSQREASGSEKPFWLRPEWGTGA
jgi:hypothetical protein